MASRAGARVVRRGRVSGDDGRTRSYGAQVRARVLSGETAVAAEPLYTWPERPLPDPTTHCGGGIAASSDAFVLTLLGHAGVAVYDASLSEWAAALSLPMDAG